MAHHAAESRGSATVWLGRQAWIVAKLARKATGVRAARKSALHAKTMPTVTPSPVLASVRLDTQAVTAKMRVHLAGLGRIAKCTATAGMKATVTQ